MNEEQKKFKLDIKEWRFNYTIDNREYLVEISMPNEKIKIPYILAIPTDIDNDYRISLETNNLEDTNQEKLLQNGLRTCKSLGNVLKDQNSPIIVPILPSTESKTPYFQQLSRETFEIESPYQNIDEQILEIIKESKRKIFDYNQVEGKDKIFLNGYSSSGVFAQRFCLIHPEIVDTACIGGASASIPVPIEEFDYPIGIKDYKSLFNKNFNIEEYKKIKFRYYVGEFEEERKTNERFTEDGNMAPMHDMTYMERSMSKQTGQKLRKIFGKKIIERANNITTFLNYNGVDITHQVFKGRSHNNSSGIGVNELGDIFINKTYKDTNLDKKIELK